MKIAKICRRLLLASGLGLAPLPVIADSLPIARAEALALAHDSGYTSLIGQSKALADKATADSQLPDPMISLGWLNVPVEDFNLGQEPMNQIRVAVKQTFPAGDSRALKKDSVLAAANAKGSEATVRHLSVLEQTRKRWLEAQYAESALAIVNRIDPLFAQLRDVTRSLYGTGKKSLNDVVRAELEFQRLQDRKVVLDENAGKQRAMLARWVGSTAADDAIPASLPDWNFAMTAKSSFAGRLLDHPSVVTFNQKVDQMRANVALARQQYKPSWSLEVGYAFRNARRANGAEVSDLASIGASMNLPLFTANRQDKSVAAAEAQLSATLDARLDLINALDSRLAGELVRLEKLNERIALHKSLIVPQARQQSQSALLAYESGQADFAEVMRSRIALLDTLLALRRLETDRLETISSIWYLLPPPGDQAIAAAMPGAQHEQ
ncbi:MAG TPA: TolC family protein [Pseudomonadales bacterium]|nr:TolC family protein [Pseudomonadales bacterium]